MVQVSAVLRTRYRAIYHWKRHWGRGVEASKLSGPIVPPSYHARGVKLINAATEQKEHESQIEGHFEWKPEHPQFNPAIGNGPENPRDKDIPCRIFGHESVLPEGVEQAQILTNTVVNYGVPPVWQYSEQQIQPFRLANEDERARQCVMQSVRWDPSDAKLPRRSSLHWGHKYPIYYGITLQKASDLICQNLLRLTELCFAGRPQLLMRHLVKNALVNVPYEPATPKDSRVVLNCNNALMLTSDQPLQPFFNAEEVNATKDMALPTIYPLKSTINLDEVNVYDWETTYPFVKECPFSFPHTIFVHHNALDEWTLAQKQATALIHSHATLAALARKTFGDEVGVLPYPLSVQCVHSDRGRKFTFYAYQLNTLNLSSSIKNQIYIDTDSTAAVVDEQTVVTRKPYVLFTLADQLEGLLGYQVYHEKDSKARYRIRTLNSYDPIVMTKLMTLYATQLHLGHHEVPVESPVSHRAASV